MASMDLLLQPFGPCPEPYDTPMAADALTRIRDPVSPSNPLVDRVSEARSILGLGLYITRGVRTDCLFPAIALSQYIVNHLTQYVWNALLRWAFYLVSTRDMVLVLRPPPLPTPPDVPPPSRFRCLLRLKSDQCSCYVHRNAGYSCRQLRGFCPLL